MVKEALPMEELKRSIIDRVASKSSEEVRFKSQARGDPQLNFEEKEKILTELLDRSPAQFLFRFGLTLHLSELEYFRHFQDDFEVGYHIRSLEERLNAERFRILTRNRRFAAVARLENSGYFDDLEMQKRDPLLYEELVEKYMTEDEKLALQKAQDLREMAAARIGPVHPFADLLMESLIEKPAVDALKSRQRERDMEQTEETEETEETVAEPTLMELDDRGRELLRQEFRHIMQERFLEGKDSQYLNYEEIDSDANLDDCELADRDQEERYFDEEDPSPRVSKKFRVAENDEIPVDQDFSLPEI